MDDDVSPSAAAPAAPGARRGLVVGTAGHIDHGKTALVRMLTGVDLDTLPEEQDRGITIALGFAAVTLPDGRRASLVDVPGHEALVRTMIAGASGLDGAMLVVSAVDGAMPQTREHLAILEMLGVSHGIVVLTMADRVEDPELLELARAEVEDLVAGTMLQDAPVVVTSAVSGQGRQAVLDALATLPAPPRPESGPFRLPVDRAFTVEGFGTVVTGTAASGRVRRGDTVRLRPDGGRARVRTVQVHGEAMDGAGAGERVALNLAGVEVDEVPRGTVVSTGPVPCPHVIDVHYTHVDPEVPLEDGDGVRWLSGTTERIGRAHLLGGEALLGPGESAWMQVRLDGPVPTLPRDRFVLRRPSPETTLGGGTVIDPWAPTVRGRRRPAAAEALARLAEGGATVWLERAGDGGLDPDDWAFRQAVSGWTGRGDAVGDRILAPRVVGRLEGVLLDAVLAFHAEHPLALGAPRRALHRDRLGHVSPAVFDGLVDRLARAGTVVVQGALLRAASFTVRLTEAQQAVQEALVAAVEAAGLTGTSPEALREAVSDDPEAHDALVALAVADGRVVRMKGVGLVGAGPLRSLTDWLAAWFQDHDRVSPGDVKAHTGLTRKTLIPLLEWLDGEGFTRRDAEGRRPGPRLGLDGDRGR